jgi:hypothetical protein
MSQLILKYASTSLEIALYAQRQKKSDDGQVYYKATLGKHLGNVHTPV